MTGGGARSEIGTVFLRNIIYVVSVNRERISRLITVEDFDSEDLGGFNFE